MYSRGSPTVAARRDDHSFLRKRKTRGGPSVRAEWFVSSLFFFVSIPGRRARFWHSRLKIGNGCSVWWQHPSDRLAVHLWYRGCAKAGSAGIMSDGRVGMPCLGLRDRLLLFRHRCCQMLLGGCGCRVHSSCLRRSFLTFFSQLAMADVLPKGDPDL